MARLVIEEDVRLQHSEDLALLNSAEKECIVCHDAPTFKSFKCALVGGGITCSYDRNADSILVIGILLPVHLLNGLNL